MTVKILAADDSATMRKVLEMTFAGEDVALITVDSGEAAVAAYAQHAPDVVLADVSMGVDGYEIARQIKSAGGTAAVIVMASQHHAFDAARAQASGVDDHVLKPWDSTALIEKVLNAASAPRASQAAAAPPPVAAAPPAARPPAAPPARQAPPPPPAAAKAPPPPPRASAPGPVPVAAHVAAGAAQMSGKLSDLGLTPDQVNGVLALSRDVIEQVVWEVVPNLAETIIREEIRRLTAG